VHVRINRQYLFDETLKQAGYGKSRPAGVIYRFILIRFGIFSSQLALLGLINFLAPLSHSPSALKYVKRTEIFRTAACIARALLTFRYLRYLPILHAYEYTEAHLIFLARSKYEYRYRCCNCNATRDNIIHPLPLLSN